MQKVIAASSGVERCLVPSVSHRARAGLGWWQQRRLCGCGGVQTAGSEGRAVVLGSRSQQECFAWDPCFEGLEEALAPHIGIEKDRLVSTESSG